jgi:hypothetical protein
VWWQERCRLPAAILQGTRTQAFWVALAGFGKLDNLSPLAAEFITATVSAAMPRPAFRGASSAAAPAMCAMMVAIEPSASSRNSGSVWGGSNQGSLQTARVLTAPSPPPLSFLILSQSGEWPERETRSGKKKPQNRPGLSLPEGTNA